MLAFSFVVFDRAKPISNQKLENRIEMIERESVGRVFFMFFWHACNRVTIVAKQLVPTKDEDKSGLDRRDTGRLLGVCKGFYDRNPSDSF